MFKIYPKEETIIRICACLLLALGSSVFSVFLAPGYGNVIFIEGGPSGKEHGEIIIKDDSDRATLKDWGPTLRRLQLIGDLNDNDYDILIKMPFLKNLWLGDSKLTCARLERLNNCMQLEELELANPNLKNDSMDGMRPLTRIRELGLIDCQDLLNKQGKLNLHPFPSILSLRVSAHGDDFSCDSLLSHKDTLEKFWVMWTVKNPQSLGKMRKLNDLTLWFHRFDVETNHAIRSLGQLKTLVLCANGLSTDSYESIGTLSNLKRLELNNERLTGKEFQSIGRLRNLEYINLDNGSYVDSDFQKLSGLKKLRELTCRGPINGTGLAAFTNTKIEKLDISGEKLTSSGFAAICGLSNLQKLTICPCKSQPEWSNVLANLSQLQEFNVACPATGADSWARALAQSSNLESVNLSNSDFSDEGIRFLLSLPHLEKLNIGNTRVTDRGLDMLKNMQQLQDLTVSHCKISDAGMKSIGALAGLRQLHLEYTPITDEGLGYLVPLSNLESLQLDGTEITGMGLEHVAKLPALRKLNLRESTVRSDSISFLVGTGIESLDISHTEISEHALPSLRSLAKLKNLQMDGCGFMTKESIPAQPQGYVIRFPAAPANIAHPQYCAPASPAISRDQLLNDLNKLNADLDARLHPGIYICSNIARGWTESIFELYNRRAFVHNALKNFDKALADANAAVRLNRLSVAARNNRALAYLRLGQYENALLDLDRALEIDPKCGESCTLRNEVLDKLNQKGMTDRLEDRSHIN